jgi:tetratricopeptide (TPR) repeat protein
MLGMALSILGRVAKIQGRRDEAIAYFTESDTFIRLTDHIGIRGNAQLNNFDLAVMRGDLARATALAEEGQASGIPFVVAGNTTMLGKLAHQQGNYTLAKAHYREALLLYRSFGHPAITAWCLEGLATTLCAPARFAKATRLCAAAAAMREQAQTPPSSEERAVFEQVVEANKTALGEAAFAAEWMRGAVLSLTEAIDEALSALSSG